ncbi:MAG TPA: hypothetical protein PK561_07200 [Fervidobacterium sp.]|nr:hypothetical protein [Fervidobacterium sp.]
MRKIVLVAMLSVLAVFAFGAGVDEGQIAESTVTTQRIGLSPTMLYGRAVYGDKGQIVGYNGFGIGVVFRNYFDSVNGMKKEQFNWFWEWGTVALLIPYVGVGGDYVMPLSETNDFVITIGTIYVVPYLSFSIDF